MTFSQWQAQFPHGSTLMLTAQTGAIARMPDPDSPTRSRYYAREVHRCQTCLGGPEFCGPLLGPVDTLEEATQLLDPDVRADVYPDKPVHVETRP